MCYRICSPFALLQRAYHPRGRVLGGTSCLNYLTFIRGSRHDYNQWEAEGCTGWGDKDVLPYFLKLEDIQISRFFNSRKYLLFNIFKVAFVEKIQE